MLLFQTRFNIQEKIDFVFVSSFLHTGSLINKTLSAVDRLINNVVVTVCLFSFQGRRRR